MLRSVRLSVCLFYVIAQNAAFYGYVYHRTLIGNPMLEVAEMPTGRYLVKDS